MSNWLGAPPAPWEYAADPNPNYKGSLTTIEPTGGVLRQPRLQPNVISSAPAPTTPEGKMGPSLLLDGRFWYAPLTYGGILHV